MGSPQFGSNVIVANEYTLIGGSSLFAEVTVGVVASELKVGASALLGRTTLVVQARKTNTDDIYIGLDNTVSTTKYFLALTPGSAVELKVSTSNIPLVWGISGTAGQKLGLLEGKS